MSPNRIAGIVTLLWITTTLTAQITPPTKPKANLFPANHRSIQYVGRVDFSSPKHPRFWAPGVYIKAKFIGTYVEITVLDEVLYGTSHNSIAVVIDEGAPQKFRLKEKVNKIKVASKLAPGEHTITIC